MKTIVVTGNGTDVGKTVVSSILALGLNADYWKPIQCGEENTSLIRGKIHPSSYSFKHSVSPHHAAQLEKCTIDIHQIIPPTTSLPLVIEGVGGLMVPLNMENTFVDLIKIWNTEVIVVSRHYLGSINHTLLTIAALKANQIKIRGIIFNGNLYEEAEQVILKHAQAPCLGRLFPEPILNIQVLRKYARAWNLSH